MLKVAVCAVLVSVPLMGEMSGARQTELVLRHCAVCHTDAVRNGGLTLQHFDAAMLDPDLAAMLLSKLRGGAMGAAGLPFAKADADALEQAMVRASEGSQGWSVRQGTVTTAGMVREVPTGKPEQPSRYRLVVSCDAGPRKGEIQLSWAPSPRSGTVMASVDDGAPVAWKVEGTESMGNGSSAKTGHAAVMLTGLPLPEKTLRISELVTGESVVFPFEELGPARSAFAACFGAAK